MIMRPGVTAIVTRAEAKGLGLKRHFTGMPCRYGHVSERLVSTRDCIECGRIRGRRSYALRRPPKEVSEFAKAKELGLSKYSTGKPCIHGHCCERYVSTRACVECAKIPRYKDIDKYRERQRRRAAATRWQRKEYHKQYYRTNAKRIIETTKRRQAMLKERQQSYHQVGPLNPKSEKQWLRKNQAQLRTVKRALIQRHKARSTQAVESIAALTSPA